MHDGWSDTAKDHRYRRCRRRSNVRQPGKGGPRGAQDPGKVRGFHLRNFSDHFLRSSDETVRSLIPYYEENCGKERSICFSLRCAHNRFERHAMFLNKQAEQILVVSNASKMLGMSDEYYIRSPYTFKSRTGTWTVWCRHVSQSLPGARVQGKQGLWEVGRDPCVLKREC
jgi:hypothetical protein